MSLRALLVVVVLAAQPRPAHALGQVVLEGSPAAREIDDDVGAYYEIPRDKPAVIRLRGPGTLFVMLVNHRGKRGSAPSTLAVTLDEKPLRSLTLACPLSDHRFKDEQTIRPCRRVTYDFVIPDGKHALTLQVTKSTLGASVHLMFVPTRELAGRKDPHLITPDLEPNLELLALEAIEEPPPEASAEPAAETPSPTELAAVKTVPPAPVGPPPEPVDPVARAVTNPVTWTALGIAAIAGGVGIGFGVMSQNDFQAAAEPTVTQLQRTDLNDSGELNAIVANSLFAGAGAAFLLGGALFLVDILSEGGPAPTTSAGVASGWGVSPRLDSPGIDLWWSL